MSERSKITGTRRCNPPFKLNPTSLPIVLRLRYMWRSCNAAIARPTRAIITPRTPKMMVKVDGSWVFVGVVGTGRDVAVAVVVVVIAKSRRGVVVVVVVERGVDGEARWRWRVVELGILV
jgi:hypothetical protein